MNKDNLTDANFLIYAASHYDNINCRSTEEFLEDVKRIKYIKKLLTRYEETGELKERLILNHVIVLNNVFGPQATCRILFLKMYRQMKYIKPFLVYLNILPEVVYNVNNKDYVTSLIPMDEEIVKALRGL